MLGVYILLKVSFEVDRKKSLMELPIDFCVLHAACLAALRTLEFALELSALNVLNRVHLIVSRAVTLVGRCAVRCFRARCAAARLLLWW